MDKEANENQADELKKIFQEVEQHENKIQEPVEEQTDEEPRPKIDVLNLPPRKEVHRTQSKGFRIKFSKPFGRLLFAIIILLTIVIIILYFWQDDIKAIFPQLTIML